MHLYIYMYFELLSFLFAPVVIEIFMIESRLIYRQRWLTSSFWHTPDIFVLMLQN